MIDGCGLPGLPIPGCEIADHQSKNRQSSIGSEQLE
jgi:hypothetical protein